MYFEHNLQELRKELRQQPIYAPDKNKNWIEQRNSCLPTEMIHADDYAYLTEDERIKTAIEMIYADD